jgi:hypothetical protein
VRLSEDRAGDSGPNPTSGSAGRAAAAALRLGSSFGAALTQRVITTDEARAYAGFGLFSLLIAGVVFKWPKILSYATAVVAAYVGVSFVVRAYRLWRQKNAGGAGADSPGDR